MGICFFCVKPVKIWTFWSRNCKTFPTPALTLRNLMGVWQNLANSHFLTKCRVQVLKEFWDTRNQSLKFFFFWILQPQPRRLLGKTGFRPNKWWWFSPPQLQLSYKEWRSEDSGIVQGWNFFVHVSTYHIILGHPSGTVDHFFTLIPQNIFNIYTGIQFLKVKLYVSWLIPSLWNILVHKKIAFHLNFGRT